MVLSNTHSYQNGGVAVDITEAAEYIDEVDFTLHGYSPEMHDEFTKNPGSYSVATKNLKRFIETRKEDKPVGIILNLVPEIVANLTKIMGSIANEIGINVGPEDIEFMGLLHSFVDGTPRLLGCFKINRYTGDIKIGEPEKVAELKWFNSDELPDNLIDTRRVILDCYKKGDIFYQEYGWEQEEKDR